MSEGVTEIHQLPLNLSKMHDQAMCRRRSAWQHDSTAAGMENKADPTQQPTAA